MDKKKLSVIVPVYNNSESLPLLFTELLNLETALKKESIALELIFVDDGSRDSSLERLLEFKKTRPETKVAKLTRNFGSIHCSKAGMRFVTGDAFTLLAADLQDPPELILEMVKHWLNGKKFTICERVNREDPWTSKIFSKCYYFLIRTFVIKGYPKGGFDMALMDKSMLLPMVESSKSVYTPLLAYWLGYKPEIIKYNRRQRVHGKSGWTLAKKTTAFLDVMLGFSVTPIRFISSVGAIVALASFGYGALVFAYALIHQVPVKGFATVVTLLTFLLGLIILMLGLLGEYLIRIFDETNKRPEVIIEEVW